MILGLHLGEKRRFSNKEEGRAFQPVAIAVGPVGERNFCILETGRVFAK